MFIKMFTGLLKGAIIFVSVDSDLEIEFIIKESDMFKTGFKFDSKHELAKHVLHERYREYSLTG